jgi:hypothetical protein
VPPFCVHSSAVAVIVQPVPLQLFAPLQELVDVLQALWPLQAFAPIHFTEGEALAGPEEVSELAIAELAIKEPIVAARTIPNDFFIPISLKKELFLN